MGVSPTDVQKNIKELAEQFSFISGNSVDPLVRSCLINFLMGEFAKKGKSLLSGFLKITQIYVHHIFRSSLPQSRIRSLLQVKDTKTIATEQD